MGVANISGNILTDTGASLSSYLPLTGGTLTGALTGTSATFSGDVSIVESGNALLRVQASTITTPIADIELMRGTNNTWGADGYGDYRFRSSGGDLLIQYGDTGVTSTRLTIASTGAATFTFDNNSSGVVYSRNVSGTIYELGSVKNSGSDILYQGTGSVFINADSNSDSTASDREVKLGNRGVAYMTLASTGAATFSSTITAGSNVIIPSNYELSYGNGNVSVLGNTSTNTLQLKTSNTTQLTIASTGAATFASSIYSGNVYVGGIDLGIATTRLIIGDNSLTNTRGLGFFANDGTKNPRSWIKHITATSSQYMEFSSDYSTASSYSNFIFQNGYVGINVTNPQRYLEVYSATADSHLRLSGNAPSVSMGEAVIGSIYQAKLGLATASNQFVTGSVAGDFVISNQTGSTIWAYNSSEKMRLNTNGRLLLNTTTDSGYLLDVNGYTRVQSGGFSTILTGNDIQFNRAGVSYITATGTGSSLNFGTNNTNSVLVLASSGAATFSGSVSATNLVANKIQISQTTGNSYITSNVAATTSLDVINTNTTNGYGLYVQGGVGSTSYALNVVNAANTTALFTVMGSGAATFSSSVTAGGNITVSKSGDAQLIASTTDASGSGAYLNLSTPSYNWYIMNNVANTGDLRFRYNGSDKLTIATSGAATFSSSVTANAASTINGAYPQLILNNPSAGAGIELHFKDNGTLKSKIGTLDDINSWQVYNGGAIRFTINNSGNVGIATSSPSKILTVRHGAADGVRIEYSGGTDNMLIDASTISAFSGTSASFLKLNPTGGNVAIGTTTDAGYKLYVNGSMYVTGAATYAGGVSYSGIQTFNNTVNLNSNTNVAVNQNIVWKGTTSASDFSMGNGGLGMYILSSATIDLNAPITQRVGLGYTFAGSSTTYNVQLLNSNISNDELTIQGAVRMNSTTAGFIPPRMTTTQANALSARGSTYCPNGTMIFDTTINIARIWNGTAWMNLW